MSLSFILAHVPLWVWLLLAYLVWQGVSAMSDNTVSLRRVALLPLVFILWGVSGLVARSGGSIGPYLVWALGAAFLVPVGYCYGPRRMVIDRAQGLVHRAGSPWPLIRNVSLFCAQFGSVVALVMLPAWQTELGLLRSALSGVMAGYFLGWGLAFLRAERKAAMKQE